MILQYYKAQECETFFTPFSYTDVALIEQCQGTRERESERERERKIGFAKQ